MIVVKFKPIAAQGLMKRKGEYNRLKGLGTGERRKVNKGEMIRKI